MNFRIAAIVLFMSLANVPAHAGMQMCASLQLTPADEKAVREVITKVAGQRGVQWPSMMRCDNKERAYAYVRLKPDIQPDGALMNFSLDCNRGMAKWICILDQWRSAYVEMDVGGYSKRFDFRLPEDFDIKRVNPLLARTIEVRPKMTVEQECGYHPGDPPNSRNAESLLDNLKTFRFSEPVISGEIREHDGQVSLVLYHQLLRFASDPNDESDVAFRCWAWLVI